MPRAKKSPAFQLYTKDLLSDARVLAMTLEEFGCYMKLMAICWNENGLTTDMDQLAKQVHVTGDKWIELWNVVGQCFFQKRNKFQQKRLTQERLKQAKFRKSRQLNGAKGGRPKGTTRLRVGSEKEPLHLHLPLHLRSTDQDRTEENSSASPAPPEPPPVLPPVLTFPTLGRTEDWALTEPQLAEWQQLYAGLDVLEECRKALAWVRANRPKTAKGMPAFLVNWLNRCADRGARGNAPALSGKTAGNTAAAMRFINRGAQ
jgi:uncharacterized protein YdaU (DUF1376 family)